MTDDLTLIREVYKLIYFTKPIPAAEIIELVESATRAKIADEIRAMKRDFYHLAHIDDIAARVARGESE